jgi:hypothetical protein
MSYIQTSRITPTSSKSFSNFIQLSTYVWQLLKENKTIFGIAPANVNLFENTLGSSSLIQILALLNNLMRFSSGSYQFDNMIFQNCNTALTNFSSTPHFNQWNKESNKNHLWTQLMFLCKFTKQAKKQLNSKVHSIEFVNRASGKLVEFDNVLFAFYPSQKNNETKVNTLSIDSGAGRLEHLLVSLFIICRALSEILKESELNFDKQFNAFMENLLDLLLSSIKSHLNSKEHHYLTLSLGAIHVIQSCEEDKDHSRILLAGMNAPIIKLDSEKNQFVFGYIDREHKFSPINLPPM